MKKVWCVFKICYGGEDSLLGIFDSNEKAWDKVRQLSEADPRSTYYRVEVEVQ